MTEDQSARSPFAGLDKALLRPRATLAPEPPIEPAPIAEAAKPTRAPRKKPTAADVAPVEPTAAEGPPSRDQATIEAMQRALKSVGKEIFYARVAPEEKRKVDETVFALKQSGIRTSVNDIGRIALNYLLADHEANGEQSILNRVLSSKRA